MAFGDTVEDILQYKKFLTGDAETATAKQIGQSRFSWQTFDAARRELQGEPRPAHNQSWARQYEFTLAWVYVLGAKYRIVVATPVQGRRLTLPLVGDAEHPTPPEFKATFATGLAGLGLS